MFYNNKFLIFIIFILNFLLLITAEEKSYDYNNKYNPSLSFNDKYNNTVNGKKLFLSTGISLILILLFFTIYFIYSLFNAESKQSQNKKQNTKEEEKEVYYIDGEEIVIEKDIEEGKIKGKSKGKFFKSEILKRKLLRRKSENNVDDTLDSIIAEHINDYQNH